MCGRYGRTTAAAVYADIIDATVSARLQDEGAYNIAPGTFRAIALRSPDTGEITMGPGYWNFIPAGAKKDTFSPINARTETAAEKPVFKKAFCHQRCLVPADWWYEWKGPKGSKQPYAIRPREGRPFFFAGIWSKASGLPADHAASGQVTFAILTGPPSDDIADIHTRQPQALTAEAARAWLSDDTDADALVSILDSGRYADYQAWPISTAVGNVANESPRLIERIEL